MMDCLAPRGVLQISFDGDNGIRVKIKTQKNPFGFQHNPKKSLDQTLTLKKSHAEFSSLKHFQLYMYLQQKGISVMIKPVDKHDG